jgi:hypothetical protein
MTPDRTVQGFIVAAAAAIVVGGQVWGSREKAGPVLTAAAAFVRGDSTADSASSPKTATASPLASNTTAALTKLSSLVRPLSHPKALATAFNSYFAFKAEHPDEVTKPDLYFVDYGLPSTQPRGYVFDMKSLKIVDGPFTVAHGKGSSSSKAGIPTRFSNAIGSAATSLGLYLAKATYAFRGSAGGRSYRSIGMRLAGVMDGFNDNALARGVVAHGAPYVTAAKAGRSEGCPAMEQTRAKKLLPKIADGGMVFLFAPDQRLLNAELQ